VYEWGMLFLYTNDITRPTPTTGVCRDWTLGLRFAFFGLIEMQIACPHGAHSSRAWQKKARLSTLEPLASDASAV
jgi:hypothetical protein